MQCWIILLYKNTHVFNLIVPTIEREDQQLYVTFILLDTKFQLLINFVVFLQNLGDQFCPSTASMDSRKIWTLFKNAGTSMLHCTMM